MKKAFTMLELVVVIVVIGILAAMAIPRLERDNLAEAVDQIVSHIRYTQHLAMQDNRFNPNNTTWTRTRWSIGFTFANVCNRGNSLKYTIFQDINLSGNPNGIGEIARDPQDPARFMSAGWNGIEFLVPAQCPNTISKYDIQATFGIAAVRLAGCGAANALTISFDEFGRPMQVASTVAMNGNPPPRPYQRILNGNCVISLWQDPARIATITISPETGFITTTIPQL